MRWEFGGNAMLDLYTGELEVPDGVNPEDWARTEEGKAAIGTAFRDYYDNTGIKFRDFEITVVDYGNPETEESVPFTEVVEL